MPTLLNVVVERWWIRDSWSHADLAWRAVICDPALGVTSAADASPWLALARAAAHHTLKRFGLDEPSQAREELGTLVDRARRAAAQAVDALVLAPAAQPARRRRSRPAAARSRKGASSK